MPVTVAGPPVFGGGRAAARTAVLNHATNPLGLTAIGDGVEEAHDLLAPETAYDVRATIVFTDGHETAEQYISDVSSLIDERVYAIGLGTADEIQPTALTSLTNSTGGYLLLTGQLGNDDTFLLAKYYLQILAGVTNEDIVVDPQGAIAARAAAPDPVRHDRGGHQLRRDPAQPRCPGHRPLAGDAGRGPDHGERRGHDPGARPRLRGDRPLLPLHPARAARERPPRAARGTPSSRSTRRLQAAVRAAQGGVRRGAGAVRRPRTVCRTASTCTPTPTCACAPPWPRTGSSPVRGSRCAACSPSTACRSRDRARVHADVVRPDGTSATVALPERSPGVFEAGLTTSLSGVYRCTVKAAGSRCDVDRSPASRSSRVRCGEAATSPRHAGTRSRAGWATSSAGCSDAW